MFLNLVKNLIIYFVYECSEGGKGIVSPPPPDELSWGRQLPTLAPPRQITPMAMRVVTVYFGVIERYDTVYVSNVF